MHTIMYMYAPGLSWCMKYSSSTSQPPCLMNTPYCQSRVSGKSFAKRLNSAVRKVVGTPWLNV